MQGLKKTVVQSISNMPWILMASGAGICFAYAIEVPKSDVALVGLVPGLSVFLFSKLGNLIISRPSPSEKSELDYAVKQIGALINALLMLAALITVFCGISLLASLLYQFLGFHYLSILVLKVIAIAVLASLLIILSTSVMLLFRQAFSQKIMWKAVTCMVVFFIAMPASISNRNHLPIQLPG